MPQSYVYHDKNKGVAIEVDEGEILTIHLFPSKQNLPLLCNNDEIKKFYSSKSWFPDSKLKDRYISIDFNQSPTLIDISLSKDEITLTSGLTELKQNGDYSEDANKISVRVNATDPENNVLTYNYTVSAGKIIGQGASVIWDLTNVEKGTYTITVKIDDGCGDCAAPKTKSVVVK